MLSSPSKMALSIQNLTKFIDICLISQHLEFKGYNIKLIIHCFFSGCRLFLFSRIHFLCQEWNFKDNLVYFQRIRTVKSLSRLNCDYSLLFALVTNREMPRFLEVNATSDRREFSILVLQGLNCYNMHGIQND